MSQPLLETKKEIADAFEVAAIFNDSTVSLRDFFSLRSTKNYLESFPGNM